MQWRPLPAQVLLFDFDAVRGDDQYFGTAGIKICLCNSNSINLMKWLFSWFGRPRRPGSDFDAIACMLKY
jgi:hypothetical protein